MWWFNIVDNNKISTVRNTPRQDVSQVGDKWTSTKVDNNLTSNTGDSFKPVDGPKPEYDDKHVLEADVAGLSKEDVSVDLEGDTLVIRGGKKTNNENTNKGKYLYKEIKRSSFTRSFSVGKGIDKNKIKADFTNGTIKVDLPKLKIEEQKPKTHKLL